MGLIHANSMGNYVGQRDPQEESSRCPECGGLKAKAARVCVHCRGPSTQFQRSEEAMDNHHRFEAALAAGWPFAYLFLVRPNIPSWEEIAACDPGAVVKWHPELVIQRWWNTP